MKTKDLLLAYSEWLDGEGLVTSDDEGDKRTHEELAGAFVAQWQGVPFADDVASPDDVNWAFSQRLADALIEAMCKGDPDWDKSRAYEVRSHMRTALAKVGQGEPNVSERTCDECGHDSSRHWIPGGCHFGGSATSCRCNFGSAR